MEEEDNIAEQEEREITDTIRQEMVECILLCEMSDTEKGDWWRLVIIDSAGKRTESQWTTHYTGILTLEWQDPLLHGKLGHHLFAYATAYWEGSLPIERIFEIKELR